MDAIQAGKHFVAITDPGSQLADLGAKLGFRHVFLADPNIGGRYSALSLFGLVPAALVGVDLAKVLTSARNMAVRCRNENIEENPGALLGLVLGSLARAGRDKATLRIPEDRASFADWVEQLIAESTGKNGTGILPVAREPSLEKTDYGPDRAFIDIGGTTSQKEPDIAVEWNRDFEVGAQCFLWEFAIAVAGNVLGINSFDQPNVEAAKIQARSFVSEYQKTGKLPKGDTHELTGAALDNFLSLAKPGDYVALQAYLAQDDRLTDALQHFRGRLASQTNMATTLGYGPRFLHSTGQLHKGDGGNGLFIQFVSPAPKDDVPIPNEPGGQESDLSFGVLKTAQALGDAHALLEAGRRIISFEVGENLADIIPGLLA